MKVVGTDILVLLPEVKEQKGVVIIPVEENGEKEKQGTVVGFGENIPEGVKESLKNEPEIIYKEYYTGGEVSRDGNKYLVMSFLDILVIL
tara:strand:- start:1481 stop:1750 length:270 start_codon:yes stop_codon:yes gene_type:complete